MTPLNMLYLRVAVEHDDRRGWHIDLPTYSMIPGTWLPITRKLIHADGVYPDADTAAVLRLNPTVLITCPAEYCNPDTHAIESRAIQAMYRDHPHFASHNWRPPPHSKP